MTVSPVSASGPPPQDSAASKNAAISSDFETFLRMLTVQMRNQDPLNPVEGADYAVQLATFSGVEQQVKTNDLLEALGQNFQQGGISSLAGWIGREVPAPGPVHFDGRALTLEIAPPEEGERSLIEVRDAVGTIVERIEIQPGQTRAHWLGLDANGDPMPTGLYDFRTVRLENGLPAEQTPTPVFQRITEVISNTEGGMLKVASGQTVAANTVTSMRQAP